MNRVVITGLGIVSPVGIGRETFWSNLTAGLSGIGPITLFDASAFSVRIGGEVKDFDAGGVIERFPRASGIRDRKVLLALVAAEEAVHDATLSDKALDDALLHVGVGLEEFRLEDLTPYAHAPDVVHAMAGSILDNSKDRPLQTPLDCTGSILGDRYGFLAGRYTNCSACAAGTQVIGEAWQMLREGPQSIALVGATDSMLNPLGLGGFSLLRVLSDENDEPHRACRPFDASRKGTVLGEGAAFLVMETLPHARARDARIYAEVLGYGASMDAFRVSDPDSSGAGAVQSMRQAIRSADIDPQQVDCVNAHGTGTPKNDVVETVALKRCLGRRAHEIPVHAVKSMTGHMIAASGAAEAIAAVLTIWRRTVPPTINLECPGQECDLDYVRDGARPFLGSIVLSNSFGFGGQNATVLFTRCV
jgi:3-oxoacyl-[acyl-carrier-protein] synthase II